MVKDVSDIRTSFLMRGAAAFALAVALLCAPGFAYADEDPTEALVEDAAVEAVFVEADSETDVVDRIDAEAPAPTESAFEQADTDNSANGEIAANASGTSDAADMIDASDSAPISVADESAPIPAENAIVDEAEPLNPDAIETSDAVDGSNAEAGEPTKADAIEIEAVATDTAFDGQTTSTDFDLTIRGNNADAAELSDFDLAAKTDASDRIQSLPSETPDSATPSPAPSVADAVEETPESDDKAEKPKKSAQAERKTNTEKKSKRKKAADLDSSDETETQKAAIAYICTPAIQADDECIAESPAETDPLPADPEPAAPASPTEPAAPAPTAPSTMRSGDGSAVGAHAATLIETAEQPGRARSSSAPESAAAKAFGPYKGPAKCRSPSLC